MMQRPATPTQPLNPFLVYLSMDEVKEKYLAEGKKELERAISNKDIGHLSRCFNNLNRSLIYPAHQLLAFRLPDYLTQDKLENLRSLIYLNAVMDLFNDEGELLPEIYEFLNVKTPDHPDGLLATVYRLFKPEVVNAKIFESYCLCASEEVCEAAKKLDGGELTEDSNFLKCAKVMNEGLRLPEDVVSVMNEDAIRQYKSQLEHLLQECEKNKSSQRLMGDDLKQLAQRRLPAGTRNTLKKEIETLRKDNQKHIELTEELNGQLVRSRLELAEERDKTHRLTDAMHALQGVGQKNESAKISQLEADKAKVNQENQRLQAENQRLVKELNAAAERSRVEREAQDNARRIQADVEDKTRRAKDELEVKARKKADDEIASLKRQLALATSSKETAERLASELQMNLQTKTNDLAVMAERSEHLQGRITGIETDLKRVEAELSKTALERTNSKKQAEDKQQELTKATTDHFKALQDERNIKNKIKKELEDKLAILRALRLNNIAMTNAMANALSRGNNHASAVFDNAYYALETLVLDAIYDAHNNVEAGRIPGLPDPKLKMLDEINQFLKAALGERLRADSQRKIDDLTTSIQRVDAVVRGYLTENNRLPEVSAIRLLRESASNHDSTLFNFMTRIAGLAVMVLGAALLTACVATTIATYGGAAPISLNVGAFSVSMISAGAALAMGVTGACSIGCGAVLFKQARANPVGYQTDIIASSMEKKFHPIRR